MFQESIIKKNLKILFMNRNKNFLTLFTVFDIFGQAISLLVRKKSSYKTPIGGSITIGIFVFILFSFVQMVIEITDRKSPSILFRSKLNIQKDV